MRYAIMGATVEQVRSVGGTDIKETRRTGIIFATLTREQADQLISMGCQVTEVGQIQAIVAPPIVTPPVPVAAVPTYTPEELVIALGFEEIRPIIRPPLYGEGFNLAVLDTGIRETHQQINGRVVYSKNYTADPMRDGLDHGTGVCSIALAVVPLCNILNLKVLDDKGEGTEEEVALAIDDCIDLHDTNPDIAPSVINLSLGAPDDGNPYNPLRVACRAAVDRGIWVIASAGNSGPTPYSITCPATEKYVLAVGSVKYDPFIISSWSSRGPTLEGLAKPDVVCFGEDLEVASSESDTATVAKSGTSFATPFGSGFGILYCEGVARQARPVRPLPGVTYPPSWETLLGIPPKETFAYLSYITIKPEGVAPGQDCDYGHGLPFGPSIIQALRYAPMADITTITEPIMGIVALAMLFMVISPMARGLQR